MNTQDDNISAAELTTPEPTPITRNELIEKMVEHRADNWERCDTEEALAQGRNGFVEMTNEELEEIANDYYYLTDEDGNEVRYTITDADTSKPSAEAINHDLLTALKAAYVALSESDAWQDMGEEDDKLSEQIREAIALAEEK